MELKLFSFSLIVLLLAGCGHRTAFRLASVTLNNNQPCISVQKESVTKDGRSKLVSVTIYQRDSAGEMHTVWEQNDIKNPTYVTLPQQCIPISYNFELDKEYSVSVVTDISDDTVETKRIWVSDFTLEELKLQEDK